MRQPRQAVRAGAGRDQDGSLERGLCFPTFHFKFKTAARGVVRLQHYFNSPCLFRCRMISIGLPYQITMRGPPREQQA